MDEHFQSVSNLNFGSIVLTCALLSPSSSISKMSVHAELCIVIFCVSFLSSEVWSFARFINLNYAQSGSISR